MDPGVEQHDDPLLGQLIDRYRIVSIIGEGGMGRVYRARHVELDVDYAVKIIFPDVGSNQTLVDRFRREARTLSRLRHTNVVSVVDFGTMQDGLQFLVMEYVEGRTLARAIAEEGPFSPQRAVRIGRQIAEALGAAHAHGCVHRDVKPSNVMLTGGPDGEVVKLLDFGVVGLVDGARAAKITSTGRIVGTPAYMAPEQAVTSTVGAAADLYALGVIIYEMLTGDVPFDGDSMTEVLLRHAVEDPRPLPFAGGLEHVTRRLLDKIPERRPASAAALVAELDALDLTEQQAALAEPVGPLVRLQDLLATDEHSKLRALEMVERARLDSARMRRPVRWPLLSAVAGGVLSIVVTTAVLLSPGERGKSDAPAARSIPERAAEPEIVVSVESRAAALAAPAVVAVAAPVVEPVDPVAELPRALSRRGLSEADLSLLPETAALERARRAALRKRDAEEIQRATDAVLAAATSARVDAPVVGAKLDRVLAALRKKADRIDPRQLGALESEYLALGTQVRSGLSPQTYEALAARVTRLERRIAAAARRKR